MEYKKVAFISGKITGEESTYREKFAEVEKKLIEVGWVVLNPAVLPLGMPHDSYMPICLAMIDQADTVFFLPDWKNSKGAPQERRYARYKDKCIVDIWQSQHQDHDLLYEVAYAPRYNK